MIIPYQSISKDALESLIEDFVTRDGTDYGETELSLSEKSEKLLELLKCGDLLISYDEQTETCGLVRKDDYQE